MKTLRSPLVSLLLTCCLIIGVASTVMAAVWTDQADYSPGSTVTIAGDNRDGAGYLAGETVHVDVTGPYGYTQSCEAVADDAGAWSCQVVLNSDNSAIGFYNYTATGQSSGISQSGTFSDGAIKVQARPAGTTFTLQYALYDGAGCTGSVIDTATKAVDSHNDTTMGQGSTYASALLTAPATSDQGGAFLYWSGPDSETTVLTTNTSVCVANPTGPITYYAHYAPVRVTKTAVTSFTRTYNWAIAKSAAPSTWHLFKGDSGTTQYTVSVDQTGYTDSDWAVEGTIAVANLLGQAVTIHSVSDLVSGNIAATITCPTDVTFPYSLAVNATLSCNYHAGLPDGTNRTNTATAVVNVTHGPPNPTNNSYNITGSADVIFGDPTTEANKSITVDDPNAPNGGGWTFTGDGSQNYTKSFTCNADAGIHPNTATIRGTTQTASASVTVNCYDLTVTKTAATTLTRTWGWTVSKTANPTSLTLAIGESDAVNYTVQFAATSSDSAWAANGSITIHNPALMVATINSVADLVAGGFNGTVNCPGTAPYSLAAGGDLICSYSAGLPDATARTNTATATLQNYTYDHNGTSTVAGTTNFAGTANVDFANPTVTKVDECVTVSDSYAGSPVSGTVCANDANKSFTYARNIGPYTTAGSYTVDNTAAFVGNSGATGSSTATVNVTVLASQWFSEVTDSAQCLFDRDASAAGRQFNLIFTQDPTNTSVYKLTSTNPGQFYYNVYYYAATATTLVINIPAPFVTHGAMPVHYYDGVTQSGGCYTNGNPLGSQASTITGINGGMITVQIPAGATYFITVHLDYGLKGTTGWNKDSTVATTAKNTSSTYGSIANLKSYTFSFTAGALTTTDTAQTVQSENIFKKNPGVAGLVINSSSGIAKANTKVQIYDGQNKLLATVNSDQDGYYQWLYKYTGKAATFVVKAPDYKLSKSVILKSNGFLEVNFDLAGQVQGSTLVEEATLVSKLFLPLVNN